ncbi:MAG TPA: signal peptidase I [Acidimicrobiales bacterium]|nr:signal peptidase I [Acidimicrobiales bacterium]
MTDLDDAAPPTTKRASLGRRATRSTVEWIVIIGAALLVAFLVKTFLIQAFYIPSASMDPTLAIRDRVLVNKMSYRLHEVNRGDIVVFERPECDQSDPEIKDLIKRVIAVGGESVEGREGTIYVDGRRLSEPYLPKGQTTSDFGPYDVPEGHIWVMGDNRENSKDSRFLCNAGPTPIDEDSVVGRAFILVWPFNKIGLL